MSDPTEELEQPQSVQTEEAASPTTEEPQKPPSEPEPHSLPQNNKSEYGNHLRKLLIQIDIFSWHPFKCYWECSNYEETEMGCGRKQTHNVDHAIYS